MSALTENLLLKVVSEIHDPVTTTDELIPSGETSSYRSNPLGLAEFTLSRKDPDYVPRAKEVQKAEKARIAGVHPCQELPELKDVMSVVKTKFPEANHTNFGIGSTIFAVKPGDGSAREQAAVCERRLYLGTRHPCGSREQGRCDYCLCGKGWRIEGVHNDTRRSDG